MAHLGIKSKHKAESGKSTYLGILFPTRPLFLRRKKHQRPTDELGLTNRVITVEPALKQRQVYTIPKQYGDER